MHLSHLVTTTPTRWPSGGYNSYPMAGTPTAGWGGQTDHGGGQPAQDGNPIMVVYLLMAVIGPLREKMAGLVNLPRANSLLREVNMPRVVNLFRAVDDLLKVTMAGVVDLLMPDSLLRVVNLPRVVPNEITYFQITVSCELFVFLLLLCCDALPLVFAKNAARGS
ncbi:unnamed protein product [Polarella glacialis]|uniref:Uncharacterized protein n=1 Tax=Polarella glacialis TaxID=89957 RepID=A0A813JQV0_POLGL|nr:unnamed protein product [Polarella glacialis]CAE8686171.1 unnamed protein product [Polarella glacialis]